MSSQGIQTMYEHNRKSERHEAGTKTTNGPDHTDRIHGIAKILAENLSKNFPFHRPGDLVHVLTGHILDHGSNTKHESLILNNISFIVELIFKVMDPTSRFWV